jgi:hypothetical protein
MARGVTSGTHAKKRMCTTVAASETEGATRRHTILYFNAVFGDHICYTLNRMHKITKCQIYQSSYAMTALLRTYAVALNTQPKSIGSLQQLIGEASTSVKAARGKGTWKGVLCAACERFRSLEFSFITHKERAVKVSSVSPLPPRRHGSQESSKAEARDDSGATQNTKPERAA